MASRILRLRSGCTCTATILRLCSGQALGSTSVTNGAQPSSQTYYAFGEVRSGTLPTDYTFTGQKRDNEAGLHFYNARYYDPAIGRFTQADSIIPDQYNPQSLNRYAYVLNNPVKYVDPTGHAQCQSYDDGECADPPPALTQCDISPTCILDSDPMDRSGLNRIKLRDWYNANPWYNPGLDPFLSWGWPGDFEINLTWGIWTVEQAQKGVTPTQVTIDGNSYLIYIPVTVLIAMIGADGTRIDRTAPLWSGKKGMLHVENFAPGKQSGSIHFQTWGKAGRKEKWQWDFATRSFSVSDRGLTAPNWLKDLLHDTTFQNALRKGYIKLGEEW